MGSYGDGEAGSYFIYSLKEKAAILRSILVLTLTQ